MTEAEWRTSDDSGAMLKCRVGTISSRKRQLFECACIRRVWDRFREVNSRRLVLALEANADGLIPDEEIVIQFDAIKWRVPEEFAFDYPQWSAKEGSVCHSIDANGALGLIRWNAREADHAESLQKALREESARQADLLRHIFDNPFKQRKPFKDDEPTLFDALPDNPFRPYPATGEWPRDVRMLAAALYDGEDCSYALRDALLENGFADLAAHFAESFHPKGCWAMDLILGKE